MYILVCKRLAKWVKFGHFGKSSPLYRIFEKIKLSNFWWVFSLLRELNFPSCLSFSLSLSLSLSLCFPLFLPSSFAKSTRSILKMVHLERHWHTWQKLYIYIEREREKERKIHAHSYYPRQKKRERGGYGYIYIYIYICCGVIVWSKFGLLRGYYLVQVCFFYAVCQKHYKIGFQHIFWTKQFARKKSGVIIWSKFGVF